MNYLRLLYIFCFVENVQLLQLPKESETQQFTGEMATISGWGKDFDGKVKKY